MNVQLPSPDPWCLMHDFTEATHTAILAGVRVDLCADCAAKMMGGSAFDEQPRPFYAGELDHRAAMIRLDRKLDRMAEEALGRIAMPTPSEVVAFLEEARHVAERLAPLLIEFLDAWGNVVISIADAYRAQWAAVGAAFDQEGQTSAEGN